MCGCRMNEQQQVPGTLLDVLSVSDIDDNELVPGVAAAWVVHGGGQAVLRAGGQVRDRPSGVVNGAVAASYDDDATQCDVS